MSATTDSHFHQQLLQQFLSQVGEQLRILGTTCHQLLIDLSDGLHPTAATTEALFALLHTIKGNATMLGLQAVSEPCHAAEHVLARVVQDGGLLDHELVGLLLGVHDHLLGVLQQQREPERDPDLSAHLSRESEQLQTALQAWLSARGADDLLRRDIALLNEHVHEHAAASAALQRITDLLFESPVTTEDPVANLRAFIDGDDWRDGAISTERAAIIGDWLQQAAQRAAPEQLEAYTTMCEAWDLYYPQMGCGPELVAILARHLPVSQVPAPVPERVVTPQRDAHLRVDEEHIDAFMHLVGEVTIIGDGFEHLQTQLRSLPRSRDVARSFAGMHRHFTRIAQQLQHAIMQLRRVSVQPIVYKMQQLTRQVATSLDKQVRLQVSGGDLCMDKSLLETVDIALAHLIRNAIDHGIETAAKRRAAGKTESGTIHLQFRESAEQYILTLADDGAGIDPVVLAEAERSGVDVLQWISTAGTSSAEALTHISGRGVGMNAVQHAVQAVAGQLTLRHEAGQGCQFQLILPKNIATQFIVAYLMRIGDRIYGLPLAQVDKALPSAAAQWHQDPEGNAYLQHADTTMPVLDLRVHFKTTTAASRPPMLVQCRHGDSLCALGVDDLVGIRRLVRRALPGEAGTNPAIDGAALLGDGSIALLLVLQELLHRRNPP